MRPLVYERHTGPTSEEDQADIAVLIPCYNEVVTIGQVVRDFAKELPYARIYVFDNNSVDGTADAAVRAGATVIPVPRQGKGFVVTAMLSKIDADYYVLVDGDATYPASRVHDLLVPLFEGRADQVVGARRAVDPHKAYRPFHTLGNRVVTFLVNRVFASTLQDVMSGYRAFTREVAEHVPVLAGGFDVETEFTLQSLEKSFTIQEVPVPYLERPDGSFSKLSTVRDGFKVLVRIVTILKDFRPFQFFAGLAILSGLLSLTAGYFPIADYVLYRYVYHVPLAVLAGFLGMISVVLIGVGTLLATINTRFLELHALRRRRGSIRRR